MSRLLVRGGTVLDGGGGVGPGGRRARRRRTHRRSRLDLDDTGARVLDAGGAYVAPGFIDMHTHLDPSLFWDPGCDPMPQHGVTTVLIGNCSLGLVPVRPDAGRRGVEAVLLHRGHAARDVRARHPMDVGALSGVPRCAGTGGLGVHAAPLLGHSVMRLYVMGADAWERAATDDGARADRRRCSTKSMTAGAFGFSTSYLRRRRAEPAGAEPPRRRRRTRPRWWRCWAATGAGFVEFIPRIGSPAATRRCSSWSSCVDGTGW